MRLTKTFAVVIATAALFAAGCGGDDNSSDDNAQTPAAADTAPAETTPTDTTAEAPAAGDTVQIAMKDIQFSPGEQTVKVGTKVVWTNEDSVDHDVVAEEGADFKSDTFGEGGTFEFTPDKAGKIEYVCTLHPGMDGELEVTN